MAITFDLLDRLQENKVFQTAQTMNNILTLFWTGSGRTLYWTGGGEAPRVNSAI